MFTPQDLSQIEKRGSSLSVVEEQVRNFERGFPYLQVVRAATVGDGIRRLSEADADTYAEVYASRIAKLKVLKFVPASGAASRMFQALFALMNSYKGTEEDKAAFAKDQGFQSPWNFFQRINDFAFNEDLKATFTGESQEELLQKQALAVVLAHLLTEAGLNYGNLPKGLLKFHSYEDGARTPLEEHIVEGASYCAKEGGIVYLHFTVSPEHRSKFQQRVEEVKSLYESRLNVQIDISFSEQKPSTDTIAVDGHNQPFRNEDGSLLFRPAGHGALLDNLNDLDADLIFIKNIDNVVPDRIKAETIRWKKALAGVLLEMQERTRNYLIQLESPSDSLLAETERFLLEELCVEPPAGYEENGMEERLAYVKAKLSRPMRVCGMVINEGEPGGGPFWAINPDATVSLQIAESAQIDKHDEGQQAIAKSATHFNPVDLVCATRDSAG
ncbi:MAG: DUF4301 family protein, partial [Bacteroidetes bacterium]